MKMKRLFFAMSICGMSALMIACSDNKSAEVKNAPTENSVNTEAESKAVANQEMKIEIAGMSCVKGCGSSIRKELKSTGGVTDVSYDFEEGRAKNLATIKFDDSKVSEDDIILAITTLDEHKYSIGEHTVKPIK